MALKQDLDFLRFLTMGAAGTASVLDSLDCHHGHRAIELERYATANKIWAQKVKRLRRPDLLCLDCGLRIEVRAKSKLAIKMSHSDASDRQWDFGLRDEDLVAFVAWRAEQGVPSPHHQFFRVGDMRASFGHARLGARKAASEGSERDLTWPAVVPKLDGEVVEIDLSHRRIRFQPYSGRKVTYRLPPAGIPSHVYVAEGQRVQGGEEFIAGSVPLCTDIECASESWDPIRDLASGDPVDRYVAVKVAGIDGRFTAVGDRLELISTDETEDSWTRLEALAGLARMRPKTHTGKIVAWIREHVVGKGVDAALAMEGIFILSELRNHEAAEALTELSADRRLRSEIRSAAVWGLGTTGIDDSHRVLPFVADEDDDVALHALAGMGDLDATILNALKSMVAGGNDREAASACELLVEDGEPGIRCLLALAQGKGRPGAWARAALGRLPRAEVEAAAKSGLSPSLVATLNPMWTEQQSWLHAQQPFSPLTLLRQQRVRHISRER